jgi:hypothetical protein
MTKNMKILLKKSVMPKILFPLIFSLFSVNADNKNSVDLFWQGNKLYKKEDMAGALVAYNNIPEKGYAVWFNMGNAAYYVPDYAHALLFWRRAQRQAKSLMEFDAAQDNIVQARASLGLTQRDNMVFFVVRRLVVTVSPFLVQLLFLLFFVVLLMRARMWLASKRFFLLSIVSAVWLLLTMVVLIHYNERAVRGIVVSSDANVYGAAHDTKTLGTFVLGEEVKIKQQKSEWYKVEGNTASGWVAAQNIEII